MVKLKALGEKTLLSTKKTIDRDPEKIISHNKLYNGKR
jgi:hypothetical protein